MKLLKKKSVEDVAKQYKQQYRATCYWATWKFSEGMYASEIYSNILKQETINDVINNKVIPENWCKHYCSVCGGYSFEILDTEEDDSSGEEHFLICGDCIEIMCEILKENK